jgi:hypothetical protein
MEWLGWAFRAEMSPNIKSAMLLRGNRLNSQNNLIVTNDSIVVNHHVVHLLRNNGSFGIGACERANCLYGRPVSDNEKLDPLGHGATEYRGGDEPRELLYCRKRLRAQMLNIGIGERRFGQTSPLT